ncbi:MAG: cell division protein FtsZ, partial [Muribaculaceae bacterium]|nr:cell division protein FtsZ [Muribaculaceae bacterium]
MSESDNQYLDKYKETVDAPDRIMVLGVGGGGNNAVNHMYSEAKIHGVSFVVVNTDDMALKTSPVPKKLLIGPTTTKGRGAGNKPDKAREAAEESAAEISELFTPETDMVFITAGMGGGTGTGAAPVVARIARERGLLTIGIVTIPFFFEGEKKIEKAFLGANELKRYVDALLLINNDRLSDIYPDLAFDSAFAKADDTLSIAAQSISEIVTNPGYINLDMNDVDTTLRDGGTALISIGYGEGENRVTAAIEDALHSPLIKDTDVFSSKRLLFNLCYSRKSQVPFKAQEVQQINDFVAKIDKGVDVIW